MKKTLSLFLVLCLVVSMFIAAYVIVYSVNNNTLAVYAATDDKNEYDLDWEALEANGELTEQTVTVKGIPVESFEDESPSEATPVTPIVVLAVAAAACVGLGAAFAVITVRRKKK